MKLPAPYLILFVAGCLANTPVHAFLVKKDHTLPKNTTQLSHFENLPPDVLMSIAARVQEPNDLDAMSAVSQTVYDKLYSNPTRFKTLMKVRRNLMPRATPSTGATYIRRIDLEREYANVYWGPIWEAPAQEGRSGLIWFPVEQEHGQVLELDARQARKICRGRALQLGVSLRAPTVAELKEHLPFLKEFPDPLPGKPPLRISGPARNSHWTLESENGAPITFSGYDGARIRNPTDHPLPARCVHEAQFQFGTDLLKIGEGITLALLKEGFNYQEATLTGAVFTERVDLERKYQGLVSGEIWEEPNPRNPKRENNSKQLSLQNTSQESARDFNDYPRKNPKLNKDLVPGDKGLIWFPYELINGQIGHFTRAQARQRCEERSKELGLKLRPITESEAFRFREYFGAEPGSTKGYVPGVISEIQYLWDPGNDYPTQSMWAIKDEQSMEFILFNLEDGETGDRLPENATFMLRLVHPPDEKIPE